MSRNNDKSTRYRFSGTNSSVKANDDVTSTRSNFLNLNTNSLNSLLRWVSWSMSAACDHRLSLPRFQQSGIFIESGRRKWTSRAVIWKETNRIKGISASRRLGCIKNLNIDISFLYHSSIFVSLQFRKKVRKQTTFQPHRLSSTKLYQIWICEINVFIEIYEQIDNNRWGLNLASTVDGQAAKS